MCTTNFGPFGEIGTIFSLQLSYKHGLLKLKIRKLSPKINVKNKNSSLILCIIFLSPADFFQNQLFRKILSETQSDSQTVLIQIRTDIVSVLIWVQTVCKGYQQTTKLNLLVECTDGILIPGQLETIPFTHIGDFQILENSR